MQWIVSRWSPRPSSCVCHTTWCCIIRGWHTQAAGLFDFVSLSLYFLWREQEKDRDRKIIRRKKILVKLRIQYSFRFRSRETVILVQQNPKKRFFSSNQSWRETRSIRDIQESKRSSSCKKTVIHLYPRHTREKKRKWRRSEWESSIEREREREWFVPAGKLPLKPSLSSPSNLLCRDSSFLSIYSCVPNNQRGHSSSHLMRLNDVNNTDNSFNNLFIRFWMKSSWKM